MYIEQETLEQLRELYHEDKKQQNATGNTSNTVKPGTIPCFYRKVNQIKTKQSFIFILISTMETTFGPPSGHK